MHTIITLLLLGIILLFLVVLAAYIEDIREYMVLLKKQLHQNSQNHII